jgi:uncharacterized membrane protein (UPF0127 family)
MSAKDGNIYTLRIGKGSRVTFKVETVVSGEARTHGLSGRPSMPRGSGMLFIFDSISRQGMWMADMHFPLDIVWLDEYMKILHITKGAPPCASRNVCPTYSSVHRIKYAIEMNAGDADTYGFERGKNLFVV